MNIRNTRRRPWFRIIRDLMGAGMSMAKIARLCDKNGPCTVRHWAEGGEPKDSDARIILALYRQHCPEKYEAHMREFEPAILDFIDAAALQQRTRARRVRMAPAEQLDFFVTEAA